MKFEELIPILREQSKNPMNYYSKELRIRRRCWSNGYSINISKIIEYDKRGEPKEIFHLSEVIADDWEIYEEPENE